MKVENSLQKHRVKLDWDEIRRQVQRSESAIQSLLEPDEESEERILAERAVAFASIGARAADPVLAANWIEVLVFELAGERYAFETAHVSQVGPVGPVTTIPGVPNFVVGIVMNHGEVLSVVDMRSLLDLPLASIADPTSMIVLRGETMEFGLLAESIIGVERYPRASIEETLPTLANLQKMYLLGVTHDRTAILHADNLLSDPRLVVEAT